MWSKFDLVMLVIFVSIIGVVVVGILGFSDEGVTSGSAWEAPPCPGYGKVFIVVDANAESHSNPMPEEAMNGLAEAGWSNIQFHLARGTDRVTAECPEERTGGGDS